MTNPMLTHSLGTKHYDSDGTLREVSLGITNDGVHHIGVVRTRPGEPSTMSGMKLSPLAAQMLLSVLYSSFTTPDAYAHNPPMPYPHT